MVLGRKKRERRSAMETRSLRGRRLLLAFSISALLHIGIALVMRPSYRPVADFAVDFEVIEVKPGPPPKGPELPPPEPEPEEEAPKPETPKPPVKPAVAKTPSSPPVQEVVAAEEKPPVPGVETGADAGDGSGVCMHNLFEFATPDPKWLLYVSVASFRGTAYQKELGRTFSSFEIGRRLESMTGMAPADDVEALYVGARDIFDWRTFQVAVSHDGGEEQLERELKERQKAAALEWRKTDEGLEAALPGQFRFHLVGSGRVLAITYEPPSAGKEEAKQKPSVLPANPYNAVDGGVPAKAPPAAAGAAHTGPPASTGAAAESEEGTSLHWPKQVTCITALEKRNAKKPTSPDRASGDLLTRAEGLMTPDGEGHWPVAVLATRDPRAVGLGSRLGRHLGFRNAVVRGYFTEPVKIEGVMTFSGNPGKIEALAEEWREEAKRMARDPFLAMAGVSHLLGNLDIVARGNEISFVLKMREREVLSTLLFLQLQGQALERQLKSN
jgi:hypothetical protein